MRMGVLAVAAVGALAAAVPAPGGAVAQGARAPVIDAPSAKALAEQGGVLVDIRTPMELRQSGTPVGAVHVPIQGDDMVLRNSFPDEVLKAAGGDAGRPVALIDANGKRSDRAAQILAGRGFGQVLSVGEGLFGSNLGPGWVTRGLPVEPCKAC